ncbi:MAG TPA: MFS transporter [Burkholderiales bacterium]|nr:MFS transporter [Burkholderiales bacterium]
MSMDRARSGELFLNLGHALDHLFLLIYPTVVLAMAPEFGRSYSEMLPLALGGFIAFGAGSLPAGWLADRWSRRGMMIVFFVGIGAASILTGFVQSHWQIAAALTLVGLFGAIYHPVGIAMLVSGRDKVGRVLGVNGVFGNLGVAFAALIAGALAHWIDWRAAFIVPGAVSIAVGIAFALTVPEARIEGRRPAGTARTGFPRELLVRVFAVLTVTTLFGGVIFNSTTIAMPKIFDERLNALVSTTLGIGILVSFVYAFAAMAQLVVGHFLDRGALKSVLVAVIGLQLPLLLAAAFFDNYLMLVVALAMMFFVFGQIPINDAMVAAYTDEAWRSRVYGVRYVVSFGASACAVPLVALMHRYSSDFKYLFFALAAMAGLMFAAAVLMPSRRPQRAAA